MNYWLIILLSFLTVSGFSQDSEAYKLGVEGVLAIDQGNTKEGIKLLKMAWSKEPSSYDYPFEIGRAYLNSGDAKKAEKHFYPLQYHQNVQADLYLHLAQAYQQLEERKNNPNPECKKELDALRYGIQKLPNTGELYLQLAKRKIELEEPIEALVVLESGIENAPNFAPNYFWAAKLMKATGNHLWTWIYAELFLNMTDDIEMGRTAALLASHSSKQVLSGNWNPEPEKMDQDLQFLLSNACKNTDSDFEQITKQRNCISEEWGNTNYPIRVLIDRLKTLEQQKLLNGYYATIYLESNKDKFLPWLAEGGEEYERYRKWRYYNPMFVSKSVKRIED